MNFSSTFIYYNPNKTLWIDLDISKKFGFGAVVFYTAVDEILPNKCWLSSNFIQTIFFFSRLFITAEKNYWPTELEIGDFV